ncbi:hypothetical protein CRI93_03905 [Longimonas halophila]|uniref:Uncharacterized protein n=1 Tax=Longimonas halophila TaxID=1469170 RepID=A0A2H3NN07_9BACT|nr:hypothetical protein CRI93_03905 [Longimonas halophila]
MILKRLLVCIFEAWIQKLLFKHAFRLIGVRNDAGCIPNANLFTQSGTRNSHVARNGARLATRVLYNLLWKVQIPAMKGHLVRIGARGQVAAVGGGVGIALWGRLAGCEQLGPCGHRCQRQPR